MQSIDTCFTVEQCVCVCAASLLAVPRTNSFCTIVNGAQRRLCASEWTAARLSLVQSRAKKRQKRAERTTAHCAPLRLLFDSIIVYYLALNFAHDASEGRSFICSSGA